MNIKTIAIWILKIVVAIAFLGAGANKLAGNPMMVTMFGKIGVGQGFRYLTGGLEVAGALLVLWPRTTFYGALILVGVSVGALVTQAAILHGDVIHTIVLIALTGLIAYLYRPLGTAFRR